MPYAGGLTIFSIATNRYLYYWIGLVESYLLNESKDVPLQWMLLTDRPDDVPLHIRQSLNNRLEIVTITHQEWPYPTLLRYHHILNSKALIRNQNFVYIDADMLIVSKNFASTVMESLNNQSLVLVRHPGYFREGGLSKIPFYIRNPKTFLKDLLLYLNHGALGTWETNSKSRAYVPRAKRKNYVCGGIWFGKLSSVIAMCEQLSNAVDNDLKKNLIARYHDESHLNYFNAQNMLINARPEFCFDPTYPQLSKISPLVLAVDKSRDST